jgi:pyruvate kinase
MLSGETAVGKHPALVVETMRRIISVTEIGAAEAIGPGSANTVSKMEELPYRSSALANGALKVADSSNAKAIVTWSQAGGMARYLSRTRLEIPILAYTSSEVAARRMALLAGVTPIRCDPPASGRLRDWTDHVEHDLKQLGIAQNGDIAVLLAGKPLGELRSQDLLAMLRLGDPNSGFRAQST